MRLSVKSNIIPLLATALMITHSTKTASNIIRRVAFDIGSLTTKMIVADVDTNKNTIVQTLLKDVRSVGYKNDLERPGSQSTVSPEMIQTGVEALRQLKTEADNLSPKPTEYAAVATAALRAAKNGKEVSKAIYDALGIPLYIIPQEKEALLGFKGATQKIGFLPSDSVVWDAGGGSMQIIMQDEHGNLKTYGNELGFVPFSKKVIKSIQNRVLLATSTPNPLTEEQAQKAISYAREMAEDIPAFVKEKIAQPTTHVIGIGALYYATHGIPQDKTIFTVQDIEAMLSVKLNKTDEQLAPITHRAISVMVSATSLCAIIGFMKALNIKEITLTEVNMTDGLLVESEFYNKHDFDCRTVLT